MRNEFFAIKRLNSSEDVMQVDFRSKDIATIRQHKAYLVMKEFNEIQIGTMIKWHPYPQVPGKC